MKEVAHPNHKLSIKKEKIYRYAKSKPPYFKNKGTNTKLTTAVSFNKMFNPGPDVSFNGSPTVSPMTAAA